MEELPKDVQYEIMEKLNDKDLGHLCQMDKKFRELCQSDTFWKKRGTKYFGSGFEKNLKHTTDARKLYSIYVKYPKLAKSELFEEMTKKIISLLEKNQFYVEITNYQGKSAAFFTNDWNSLIGAIVAYFMAKNDRMNVSMDIYGKNAEKMTEKKKKELYDKIYVPFYDTPLDVINKNIIQRELPLYIVTYFSPNIGRISNYFNGILNDDAYQILLIIGTEIYHLSNFSLQKSVSTREIRGIYDYPKFEGVNQPSNTKSNKKRIFRIYNFD